MLEDKDKFIERFCEAVKHLHRPDQPGNGREPAPNPFGIEHKPLPDPYYDSETQRRIGELISRIAVESKKARRGLFPPNKKRIG
jgi:hypothetical protein